MSASLSSPKYRVVLCSGLAAFAGCGPAEDQSHPAESVGVSTSALVGVPKDGFPKYEERAMLVAINRARSAPQRRRPDLHELLHPAHGAPAVDARSQRGPLSPLPLLQQHHQRRRVASATT